MSASYPITFELRADDRASDSMRALLEVMHEGSSASAEAQSRFKALREDATLQTRAFNTLRTEWRADHETLYRLCQKSTWRDVTAPSDGRRWQLILHQRDWSRTPSPALTPYG